MKKTRKRENSILIGDTIYAIDKFYVEGAKACRAGRHFHLSNPYRDGSDRHMSFEYGYQNEEAEEHVRFGLDILREPLNGREFADDHSVPRSDTGIVDSDWYNNQLAYIYRIQKAA